MLLKKALIFFSNLIYPQECLICGKLNSNTICNKCENKINQELKYTYLKKIRNEYYFENQIYLFEYKDYIRRLIIDYKFKDKSYLYKLFSEIIIKNEKICSIFKSYDIIIPVPIHYKRKKERGYNQSDLIARDIANKIKNIKLENKVVIKKINNKKQSDLTKIERINNVKNVYEIINKERIKNKKIILIDDIYTTGNTVNEVSKLLKKNGAKKILVLTIARD